MEKFRVVYTQNEEEFLPGIKATVVGMHLVDEENKPVTAERLEEVYKNLSATGYKVMLKMSLPPSEKYPLFAEVAKITEDSVYLEFERISSGNGSSKISREEFHQYYEVD